jgi:AcrR family transcriptional regulator
MSTTVTPKERLRSRLLEAVTAELRERDWSELTMAAIAARAGVSRQSVYNEFGSRGELAQAYVLWEADRFLSSVAAAVAQHRDDPVAALTAAFDVFLGAAAEHPLLRALAASDGSHELLPLLTTRGQPLHERATAALAALLLEQFDGVDPSDVHLLCDAVVRLAVSHAALPSGSSRITARSLGRLLGPFAEHALR